MGDVYPTTTMCEPFLLDICSSITTATILNDDTTGNNILTNNMQNTILMRENVLMRNPILIILVALHKNSV